MRTISRTVRFKKDYKRVSMGEHGKVIDGLLRDVVVLLARDETLPNRYRDHALAGEWKSFRDCHLRPDLVLIYRFPDETSLELVRLGSHSELSL